MTRAGCRQVIRLLSAVAALVALSIMSVTVAGATQPPRVPARSTPYDYGRLRLWLPLGWATSTSSCHNLSDVVYYPATWSSTEGCVAAPVSESVTVEPFNGPIPQTALPTRLNGIKVWTTAGTGGTTVWDVPALQVQLSLVGNQARKVAATIGPSPLQDLMTKSLPIPVPAGWKIVRFDGFLTQVPPAWPTHHIKVTHDGNNGSVSGLPPGVCSPPLFRTPSVYLGQAAAISCPAVPEKTLPPTDDGVWLYPNSDTTPLRVQPPSEATVPQRLISAGGIEALITASTGDSVFVEVAAGGRRISATIGLGKNPTTAEAILSSIIPA